MSRLFIPGGVDRHGIAHPLPHCTGSCNQGRTPCNCMTSQCEMASNIPPRAEFPAPKSESLTPLQRTIATALGAFIAWAVLVGLGSVVAN